MNNVLKPSSATELIRLSGKILNYRVSREQANFIFTKNDQNKMGVIAIAASLAGMGGQAISVASNLSSIEEDADYVEFDINGNPARGWLWFSPFKEGDEVEVAAEWQSDHYEIFGIIRPSDQTIALYPHCSRAINRHIKNAIKWWAITVISFYTLISILMLAIEVEAFFDGWKYMTGEGWWMPLGMIIFIAIAVVSMTKQWMPFARIAQKVFTVLGLPDPHNIDLVKSSKNRIFTYDTNAFGSMYFRY